MEEGSDGSERAPDAEPGPGPDEAVRLRREIARLEEELSRANEKAARADEYLDLAQRQKADFLNYQDRVRRERREWKRDAVEEFIRDFLPALDAFTWARFEEPTLMESLRLVEHEFLRILAKHGIRPIEAKGKAFDPSRHEAVALEDTDREPPGSVLEEVRRGWVLGDHVIRPAGVRVARPPAAGGAGPETD